MFIKAFLWYSFIQLFNVALYSLKSVFQIIKTNPFSLSLEWKYATKNHSKNKQNNNFTEKTTTSVCAVRQRYDQPSRTLCKKALTLHFLTLLPVQVSASIYNNTCWTHLDSLREQLTKKETQKSILNYCTYSSISCPNTSWTCFSDLIMSPILFSIWVRSTLITWKTSTHSISGKFMFLNLKLYILELWKKWKFSSP